MKFLLFVDGASRGNPGPAAIGVSLQNGDGEEIEVISQAIGRRTNNEAEYLSLIEGLRLALNRRISEIEIRADSQLVVRQLRGEYKVKHANMKPLFQEAKTLLGRFERHTITHIPREDNARADELANHALDESS